MGSKIAEFVTQYEKREAEMKAPSLADIAAAQHHQLELYCARTQQLSTQVEQESKRAATAETEVGELKVKLSSETNRLEADLAQCKELLAQVNGVNAAQKGEIALYQQQIARFQAQVLQMQEQLRLGDAVRRHLHNQVLELKGNIRVFCRVRPNLPHDPPSTSGKPMFTFPVTTSAALGGMTVSASTSTATANYGGPAEAGAAAAAAAGGASSPSPPSSSAAAGSGAASPSEGGSDLATTNDAMAQAAISAGLTERNTLIFRGKEEKSMDGSKVNKTATYSFDRVFTPEEGNGEVFDEVSQLVQSALDGYKVCIFAYGQTGSGKTHTMEGDGLDQLTTASSDGTLRFPPAAGITSRAVYTIFAEVAKMKRQGWVHTVRVHSFEIYDDTVYSLLPSGVDAEGNVVPSEAIAKRIVDGFESEQVEVKSNAAIAAAAKEAAKEAAAAGGIAMAPLQSVNGCEPITVRTSQEVFALLAVASALRRTRGTAMNARSSRSHCIFQMFIEGRCDKTGEARQGIINLVDLAGSERVKLSKATGEGLAEASAINSSLSSLGDVIVALGSGNKHIPYRNSKLTYLLQNCFGADSKTLMIVNMSPTEASADETLCSLRFASRVNNCHLGVAQKAVKHA